MDTARPSVGARAREPPEHPRRHTFDGYRHICRSCRRPGASARSWQTHAVAERVAIVAGAWAESEFWRSACLWAADAQGVGIRRGWLEGNSRTAMGGTPKIQLGKQGVAPL